MTPTMPKPQKLQTYHPDALGPGSWGRSLVLAVTMLTAGSATAWMQPTEDAVRYEFHVLAPPTGVVPTQALAAVPVGVLEHSVASVRRDAPAPAPDATASLPAEAPQQLAAAEPVMFVGTPSVRHAPSRPMVAAPERAVSAATARVLTAAPAPPMRQAPELAVSSAMAPVPMAAPAPPMRIAPSPASYAVTAR